MTFYYIDQSVIPAKNAHSIQININCEEIYKNYSDFRLISYNLGKITTYPHKKYIRPNFFNKIIPYSIFHLIYKINKDFKFDKKKDFLITRSPFIAWFYRNKFKKIILELHNIPHTSFGFLKFFFFDLLLLKFPLGKIKNSKNVLIGVISYGLERDLIKLGFNKDKIFVIPDGVYLEKYSKDYNINNLKKELGLPLNKKIVMYVGSLGLWKGVNTLLEASKNFNSDTQLVIGGGEKKELETLRKKYPMVVFLGKVDFENLSKYFKSADVLVLPNSGKFKISSHYTSPIKLFEYMASSKPILASNLPSIREVLSIEDGYFFKADSEISLTKNLKKLLSDKKLMARLAINARKRVENYTWEKRVNKILINLK